MKNTLPKGMAAVESLYQAIEFIIDQEKNIIPLK